MSIFSDDNPLFLEGGGPGGSKTQKIREKVRNAAPRHVYLIGGDWEKNRLFQLASATTLDVNYIREDLALTDLAYRLARHIRNTDEIPVAKWGFDGLELLAELRQIDVERYDSLVKGPTEVTQRPKIICLCGSTRFVDTWVNEYQRLSDEGNIVLTVARMPPRPNLQHEDPALKIRLDNLHLRKIDLADEIFVLNVDNYVGDSTKREIEYAESKGKVVKYLEKK